MGKWALPITRPLDDTATATHEAAGKIEIKKTIDYPFRIIFLSVRNATRGGCRLRVGYIAGGQECYMVSKRQAEKGDKAVWYGPSELLTPSTEIIITVDGVENGDSIGGIYSIQRWIER